MFLNHAFSVHPQLTCIYLHHEQACAYAAEGYWRASGRMAAVCVTSGPGALNTVTGVWSAYVDSVPMVVISGQADTRTATHDGQRQIGDQEANVHQAVAAMVKDFQYVCLENGEGWKITTEMLLDLAVKNNRESSSENATKVNRSMLIEIFIFN